MKIVRIVVSALIIIMSGLSIFTNVNAYMNRKSDFISFVEKGDTLNGEGLYQRASAQYAEALKLEENLDVRIKYTDANIRAYEDGVLTKKKYFSVLDEATGLYSEYIPFWEKYLQACIDENDYATGYLVAQKSIRLNIQGENVDALRDQILYSYKNTSTVYSSFSRNRSGDYAACSRENWGTLDQGGEKQKDYVYSYISPINSGGEAVYDSDDKGSRLISSAGVVEYIFKDRVSNARAVGSGMLPVRRADGSWEYMAAGEEGTTVSGVYQEASSFTEGIAAVKAEGKWRLIGTDGNPVSEMTFDDIKLYDNGEFIRYEVMTASVDGRYGLYDRTGILQGEFTAKDIDLNMGDLIAYQADNGDWGYINSKGEIVIEPVYNRAKSFSGGLGAVYNGSLWGFISPQGRLVIGYTFLNADYFTEKGFCMVQETPDEYHGIRLRY